MAELLINNKDAYAIWGVKMGKGFLDVLGASSPMKEFIENKSRLEHGKRVIVNDPKIDEREITLHLQLKENPNPTIKQRKKLSLLNFIKARLIFKFQLTVVRCII